MVIPKHCPRDTAGNLIVILAQTARCAAPSHRPFPAAHEVRFTLHCQVRHDIIRAVQCQNSGEKDSRKRGRGWREVQRWKLIATPLTSSPLGVQARSTGPDGRGAAPYIKPREFAVHSEQGELPGLPSITIGRRRQTLRRRVFRMPASQRRRSIDVRRTVLRRLPPRAKKPERYVALRQRSPSQLHAPN